MTTLQHPEKVAENQSNAPQGSSWTAGTAEDIKALQDQVSSVTVVDPRHTSTSKHFHTDSGAVSISGD